MAQRFSTHVCVSFVPYWNGTSCSHRMFIAYNGRRKGWGNDAWINVSAKTFLQKTLRLFVTTLCLCSVWDEATWLGFWKTSWFETPVLVSTITDGECLTSLEKKPPKKQMEMSLSLIKKQTNKKKQNSFVTTWNSWMRLPVSLKISSGVTQTLVAHLVARFVCL